MASSWAQLGSVFERPIDMAALLKANDITVDVQRHLVNVYAALAATILSCALGAVVGLRVPVGGLMTTLAGFGALVWLRVDPDKTNRAKRASILVLFGFLQGLGLAGLVDIVLEVDASILVTALLATTTVFLCFAGAALFSKRRSYLYLGGVLSTGILVLLSASLLSLFVRAEFLFNLQLYAGLAIFCGYVIYDTQVIVEKASLGDRDFAWHAVTLFVDFIAIFVRVCIILLRNREGGDRRERKANPTGRTYRR
ncbi:unnamed protein product [Ascophyllum nodosum]